MVGATAPALSRAKPVRRVGFDIDVRVARAQLEAEDVVGLTLARPDGRALPRWTPGAHLDLFLPSGRQRSYSLCGDPEDLTRYRIAVRLVRDGGGGSAEIHRVLHAGTTLRMRGPRNAFPLIAAPSYLFIAGGIGITPILPMVRALDRGPSPSRLVYLGRSRASMPFLDEVRALEATEIDIRPDDEVGSPNLAEVLSRAERDCAVYVCGPSPVLDAAHAVLGLIEPTASLHTERFSAPPVVPGKPFEVRLKKSGRRVLVGADESALAAIRREVPDAAYSCQQGICGTCRVGVLDGQVDHRDHLLTPRERSCSMLICVSRSAGGPLVLDL